MGEHKLDGNELSPSWEALRCHWLRSCWVSHFWAQACSSTYQVLALHDHGWKAVDGELLIDRDHPENVEQVKQSVRLLIATGMWVQERLLN